MTLQIRFFGDFIFIFFFSFLFSRLNSQRNVFVEKKNLTLVSTVLFLAI